MPRVSLVRRTGCRRTGGPKEGVAPGTGRV